MRYLILVGFTLATQILFAQQKPEYTIFLVGDAGKVSPGQTNAFSILKSQLDTAGDQSTLVYLGDNIYPQGMPDPKADDREEAEKVVKAQTDVTENYEGQVYFIPGNHDWAQGRRKGFDNLLRQEKYVEAKYDTTDMFLPSRGCPGPVEVSLSDEITLIIIDTQWFLHRWDKPDEESGGCESANAIEVLQRLDNIIARNAHKKVIVTTHHPMYTYGSHGGYMKTSAHFLPPILGSIHPIYRKYIGSVQDVTHPKYRAMRNAMVGIFEKYPNLIHAAGHEHSLQYSSKDSIHYIVSGSASKQSFVRQKGYAEFAESANGFARLDFYSDGKVEVEYWKPDELTKKPELAFEKLLMEDPYIEPITVEEFEQNIDLTDSVVITNASNQYAATKTRKKLFGANYRNVWSSKLEVPVFDIGNEHGGLEIVQRGGGMQTKSLRLESEEGKQYVLRSIEKYPENAVPELLRNTFAVDLVQDQISAAHPYGALVVPHLAEAAGIYHTNPKLVFIPDDPRFGIYRRDFANTLALYEERPAHDWSDADFFGNSPDIESTRKVLEELVEDNDNEVDQRFVLKSRLFDLIIGDWDRHDDQWRWSERDKESKGKRYRPIPRDRDQAFFVNEGFFPEIWSRKWALPKFEGFDNEVNWPSGLMFNARYFDRSFLTELEREEWIEVAKELQNSLTDERIENAISQWPEKIYDLDGETVIANLKARRDKLVDYAIDHYEFLAEKVNVLGSDKHEHFQVDRLANGDVHVVVRKMKKDGEKKHVIFDRLFKYGETKEVRLYGFAGEDEFEIEGEANKSIKVRVIGGEDEDELDDDSKVRGLSKRSVFYDTKKGNEVKLNSESRNKLSDDTDINDYDRREFKYNVLTPLITGNFNPDDGIFLGGGFLYVTHGFRKDPFKWKNKAVASYAINTSSYNFTYEGTLTDAIKKWDFVISSDFRIPDFTINFFGMGNESQFDQNIDESVDVDRAIDFYRLRFQAVKLDLGLEREIGAFGTVGFHANYISWKLEESNEGPTFVENFVGSSFIEQTLHYAGGTAELDVDTRKNKSVPEYGIHFNTSINTYVGLESNSDDFHQFETSFAFFHSFRLPARLTFALRTGYGANLGDYPFFVAQTLGGKFQLRGFRRTRFYGDQRFYNNFEMRLKLFRFRTYLFPATLGILGFHDIGRVWLDGEDSDKWHRGVGGGIWFTPFNLAALSAEVGRSEEETLFYVRLGFLF